MKKRNVYLRIGLVAILITAILIAAFLIFKQKKPELKKTTPTADKYQTNITATPDSYVENRDNMVEDQIASRGVEDTAVLTAMRAVPRQAFVLDRYLNQAYADHPLPIGYGQTISQPYIVALMTEILEVKAGDRVLEIGTGSGYQAAVLAEIDTEVYTIEIISELAAQAEERLDKLNYTQIHLQNADGYFGWEEQAPYDAIIVTAAPDHLPHPLTEQLKEGGRMVIPIGPIGAVQTLWLFEKQDGELESSNLGAVRFVPLTGEH
ncbi:MAG: protein-L-isoaspartate(D-aspartate) O-methyltransferase [Chloroflexota bacterium]|nr:protein-L-isoaspartate(D-aspartate) O-methyltransferase [Chloroflexota bacterium]